MNQPISLPCQELAIGDLPTHLSNGVDSGFLFSAAIFGDVLSVRFARFGERVDGVHFFSFLFFSDREREDGREGFVGRGAGLGICGRWWMVLVVMMVMGW